MGVPTFFKWICTRYPRCVKDAVEKATIEVDGFEVPVDFEESNPNGLEFDNLYLDMNGIIHPCSHPEDGLIPENEDKMFLLIAQYVDRLVRIVRPRKLLYLAVDGVAPRAKMNQQRSRRYRAAQEAQDQEKEELRVRNEFLKTGRPAPETRPVWDSNVITPGTEFLAKVTDLLHWYVADRMTHDPLWRVLGFRAVISDASVPGEGEHKIMQYIRAQRQQPGYNPNLTHCIFGADADLIMLGLVTHETNFQILREVVVQVEERRCYLCNKSGHLPSECAGDKPDAAGDGDATRGGDGKHASGGDQVLEKPLQLISLPVLREYLGEQFGRFAETLPFTFDIERIIDDFVFICFFVGNDFLPHLPSLSIREGSIDQMVCLYTEILPTLGDYLTDAGTVNLVQTEVFLDYLGRVEDQVFKARLARDDRLRQQRAQSRVIPGTAGAMTGSKLLGMKRLAEDANLTQARKLLNSLAHIKQSQQVVKKPRLVENMTAGGGGREEDEADLVEVPTLAHGESGEFYSEVRNKLMQRQDLGDRFPDTIRLGADNAWKQRYYFEKFSIKQEDLLDFVARIRLAYIEGIQWVLLYYYQGCPSWTWYYPYHYAPFASDLVGCSTLKCAETDYFESGAPFKPFMQLMAVLPPRSAKAAGLPASLQQLFSSPESPLIDFYPEDFALDLNGKKFLWQAVVLLPFIKEERLISVLEPLLDAMADATLRKRNLLGTHVLYVPAADNLARQLEDVQSKGHALLQDLPYTDPRSQGNTLFGTVKAYAEGCCPEEIKCPISYRPAVSSPRCIRALFDDAKPPASAPLHSTQLLPGATPPRPVLDAVDFAEASRWRGFGGEPAKRMILQVLQELGFHTAQHIAKPVGPSELSGPPAAFPGAQSSGGFAAQRPTWARR